jgi:hypothetical protein
MIERLDEVPDGVIGLRGSGKLTKDDYASVLEPALKEAIADGDARVLFVLPDFDGLEEGAWVEDVKTGLDAELRNRSQWKRLGLVTGVDWIAKSMRMFAWLAPGEVKVFPLDQFDQARDWVAG